MTRATFTIGNKEKHTVEIEASSMLIRRLKIKVDNREVSNTLWSKVSGNSVRFSIGEKEIHQAEVKVSGNFSPKLELFLDGKLEGVS